EIDKGSYTATVAAGFNITTSSVSNALTIVGASTLDVSGTFDHTGLVTSFGAAGTGKLILRNTVTDLGTFTAGNGTVQYTAAVAQAVDTTSADYFNLTVGEDTENNIATAGSISTASVTNQLSILGPATLDVTGSFDATGRTVTFGAMGTGKLVLRGNVTSLGNFTAGTATVQYAAGAAQTVDNKNYYNLTVGEDTENGTATASFAVNPTNLGNQLSILGPATLDVTGNFNATGRTVTFDSTGRLRIGGTPTALGVFTRASGTVEFYLAGAVTVPNVDYWNLEISNGCQATIGFGITPTNIGSTLQITGASSADVNAPFDLTGRNLTFTGGGTLELGGTVGTLGNFSSGTGTVVYNYTAGGQTVATPTTDYYNLTIDNSNQTATAAWNVNANAVENALTISGTSTLECSGAFDLTSAPGPRNLVFGGAGTLRVGGTVSGFGNLTLANSTIVFYSAAADQSVPGITYYNLTISKPGFAGNAAGPITVNNNLGITAGALNASGAIGVTGQLNMSGSTALSMGASNLTVAGAATVGGTISGSTAALDFNGAANLSGGGITFSGAGTLEFSNTVANFTTFTAASSLARYNATAVDQAFAAVTYNNVQTALGSGRTLTLASGTATVNGTLAHSGGTLALQPGGDLRVSGVMTASAPVTMTGSSYLRLGTSCSLNSGASLTTAQSGGNKPTITSTDTVTPLRFAFTVNSGATINVNRLNFSYCNGDGLRIMSGATVTDIDYVDFANGSDTPTTYSYSAYLNLRLGTGAQNFYFTYCNFGFGADTDGGTYGPTTRAPDYSVVTDGAWAGGVAEMSYSNTDSTTENDKENGQVEGGLSTIEWIRLLTWEGDVSSDWANPSNWSPAFIPDQSSDVTIPDVAVPPNNDPVISANASCKNITTNSGSLLTINADKVLSAYGDVLIDGDLTMVAGSKLLITGSDPNQAVISAGSVVANIEVNKPGNMAGLAANMNVANEFRITAGEFKLQGCTATVTGATIISGTLTGGSGTLDANGSFDATGGTISFTTGQLKLGDATVTSLGSFTAGTSTVTYDCQTANQTVRASGISYCNLKIDKNAYTALTSTLATLVVTNNLELTTGNLTCQKAMDIGGELKLATGAGTFSAGSYAHTLAGDLTFTGGVFNTGTAGFTFDGATQSISGVAAGSLAFNQLTIASGSVTTANRNFSVGGNLAVDGELAVSDTRTVTATGTSDINGTLRFLTGTTNLFDANGAFDATGGNVIFTSGGTLALGGTVTSLGTLTSGTGLVTYDSGADQTVRTFGLTYYDVEIAKGAGTATTEASGALAANRHVTLTLGTLTAANAIQAGGNLTLTAGTFNAGAFTHVIGGNFARNGGTFNSDTSTVRMTGNPGAIGGTVSPAFYNLTVASNAITTANLGLSVALGAILTVDGTLKLADGVTATVSGSTRVAGTLEFLTGTTNKLDANGSFDGTGGTVTFTSGGIIELSGSVVTLGTLSAGTTGEVIYNDTAANQNVTAATYRHLTINKASYAANLTGLTTVNGNLAVQAGTVSVAGNTLNVGGNLTCAGTIGISTGTVDCNGVFDATGGNTTFSAAGTLRIDGTVTSLGNFTPSTSTVTYGGASPTVRSPAAGYYHLDIEVSGTATVDAAAASVGVAGNLTVDSGTFALNDKTLNVAGNATVGGTLSATTSTATVAGAFNATGGTITFADAGALVLQGAVTGLGTLNAGPSSTVRYASSTVAQTVAPVSTYRNLEIANSASQVATLSGTASCAGTLNVAANGDFRVAVPGDLSVAGAATVSGAMYLTGASFLRLGTGITISGAGASLETSGTTPTITSTDEGTPARYSFTVQNSGLLALTALVLKYMNADGINVAATASTSSDIDAVAFQNGVSATGTYVKLNWTSGTWQFMDCSFDANCQYNVRTPAGALDSMVVELVNASGDRSGAGFENDRDSGTDEAAPHTIYWSMFWQWTAVTNRRWQVATNWSSGAIPPAPPSEKNIRIPNPANNRASCLCDAAGSGATTGYAKSLLISTGTLRYGNDAEPSTVALNSTLVLTGDFARQTSGTFRMGSVDTTTGTFRCSGGANQNVTMTSSDADTTKNAVWVFDINKTGGTVSLGSYLIVRSNLTLTAGTLDIGANNLRVDGNLTGAGTLRIGSGTVTVSGQFNLSTGAVVFYGPGKLILKGTLPAAGTAAFGAFTAGNGTVEYAATAAQPLYTNAGAYTYYNLIQSGTGGSTADGALSVGSNVTISAGTLTANATVGNNLDVNGSITMSAGGLNLNGRSLAVAGDFTQNGGVWTPGASTVTFDGTTQAIGGTVSPMAFNTLTVAFGSITTLNTNITVAGGNLLTVSGRIDVSNGKTLTANGGITCPGTLKFLTGTTGYVDCNGTFNCSGTVEFVSGGTLELSGATTAFASLSCGTGTVKFNYTGGDTTLPGLTYYKLEVDVGAPGPGNTVTCGGNVIVGGDLTVSSIATQVFATSTYNVTVAGTTTISGADTILSIGSGTFDANGSFIAGVTTVDITGAGTLELSGTVTGPTDFSAAAGSTVKYNRTTGGQTVFAATYHHLVIDCTGQTATSGGVIVLDGDLTVSGGALALNANPLTAAGNATISATLTASTATIDVDGTFNASGGAVTFTGAGTLELGSTVSSLGTFTCGSSTVVYDSTSGQSVQSATYNNLRLDKGASTATDSAAASITCNGSLELTTSTGTFAAGIYTVSVAGATTNNGTITISSGKLDANGAYTGGVSSAVTFTGAGRLEFGGTVTWNSPLASLTTFAGCVVRYDSSAAQSVLDFAYRKLEIAKGSSTGTLSSVDGVIAVAETLDVSSGTLALAANSLTVSGATTLNGKLLFDNAASAFTAQGSFTASGAGNEIEFTAAGTLTFQNTVSFSGTNVTAPSGTVRYEGSVAQTIQAVGYYNLLVAKTALADTATLSETAWCAGTLGVTGGTLAIQEPGDLTVGGAATVGAGAKLSMSGGCFLRLGNGAVNGDFDVAGQFITSTPGASKPTLTRNGTGRFAFDANNGSTVWIQGLNLSYCDAQGLRINSGATVTDIDNVICTNGAGIPSYSTGTASTNATTTVSGSGTSWLANVAVDDVFVITIGPDTYHRRVTAVNSDTQLTVSSAIPDSSGLVAYNIKGFTTFLNVRLGTGGSDFDFSGCSFDASSANFSATCDPAYAGGVIYVSQFAPVGAADAENDRGSGLVTGGASKIEWVMTLTWTGATSTAWSNPANWNPSYPPGSGTHVTIPNVVNDPVLDGNSACRNCTLTTGVLKIDQDYTLEVYGNFIKQAGGVIDFTNGTITFRGSGDQNLDVSGSAFYNLAVNQTSGSQVALLSNANVNGGLTVSVGEFAIGAKSVTVAGGTTVAGVVSISTGTLQAGGSFDAGGGSVTMSGAGHLRLGGAVTSLGTFTAGSGTVTYFSTSAGQNVYATTYYKLTVDKTTQVASLTGTTTVENNLVVTSGTLAVGAQSLNANTVGGTTTIYGTLEIGTGTATVIGDFDASSVGAVVSFTGAGLLKLGGIVSGFDSLTNTIGTVEYNSATANQDVYATTYYSLKISKTGLTGNIVGTTNLNGSLTVGAGALAVGTQTLNVVGSATVSAGTTLSASTGLVDVNGTFDATGATVTLSGSGGRLYLGGTVTSLGTFSAASGSYVRYDGASAQTVKGGVTYHHLEIVKGASAGTLDGNATVNGNLWITSGALDVAAYALGIAGTTTVSAGATLQIATGTVTCTGSLDAGGANVTFTAAGLLRVNAAPTAIVGLGSLTSTMGTVEYTNSTADQNVFTITYFNLKVSKSGWIANCTAGFAINGALDVAAGTLNLGSPVAAETVSVGGATTVGTGATLTIPGLRKLDANGSFTAAGATVNLSSADSRLELGGSVASLGTINIAAGATVRYDSTTVDQSVPVAAYQNLEIADAGRVATAAGAMAVAVNLTATSGTFATAAVLTTVTGTASFSGGATLQIDTNGTFDANGTFNAGGGNVNFAGAGRLRLSSTVTSLGTLTSGTGTVEYDGAGAQDVRVAAYNHLEIDKTGAVGTLTGTGTTTVGGNLILTAGELAVADKTLTVDGTTSGAGALTASTGTIDANGAFNSTGSITFTGAGTLELSAAVGTSWALTAGSSTTIYNSTTVSQTVRTASYNNLRVACQGQTAELSGVASCAGWFELTDGTFDMLAGADLTVTGTATVTKNLALIGNCVLRLGTSLTIGNGGSLSTQESAGSASTITWTGGPGRFAFTVDSGSAVFIQGLNFSGCDVNGLRILSGATVTDIDKVTFSNGPGAGSGTFMNIRLGTQGGDFSFSECSFDATTQYNVTTDSQFAGVIEILNASGAGTGESREDDNEAGEVPGGTITWPAYKIWTGTTNSDWATGTNWLPNGPPTLTDNVQIPNELNDPIISAEAACKSIEISTGTLT
ncbi:MAG: hypothetical protein RDV41_01655, partial [Planctomycetota bacterium]|nr:hypothetical protein [Planctomycetota bacterium]